MKTFVPLLVASAIVGFLVFASFYWLINRSFSDAVNIGISGAFAGLSAEYLKMYLERRRKNRVAAQQAK